MQKMGKTLWLALFFALVIVRLRGEGGGGDATSMKRTSLPQPNDVGKSIETSNTTSMKRIGLPQSNNVEKSNETSNNVVVNTKKKNNGGSMGGGGGAGWGWGGGGGGGNRRGGWGWGSGGGGGVFWRWGCNRQPHHQGMTRDFPEGDYRTGEFAQCMVKGRCRGMRLDCPLHCGGPCFYDCRHMCKAHCKR